MLSNLLNILWKNQNWIGRLLLIFVVLLLVTVLYYRVAFGIYKHKYVQGLELQMNELQYENEQLREQKKQNRNTIRKKAIQLVTDKDNIEQKRKQDEEIINNSTVTNKQRKDFLSKYENR